MSEYDTGNPVPSASMPDAWDNMQSIDMFANSSDETITTRTGKQLDTLHGINVKSDNQRTEQQDSFELSQSERASSFEEKSNEFESRFSSQLSIQESTFSESQTDKENRFQQFLLSSGYIFLGDYGNGPFQFSARNQYIRYDNQYYRLNAATDVGFTTTGTDATSFANDVAHFVLMDGDTLRQDLASREYGLGAYLDGWARNYSCEVAANVAVFLSAQKINLWEYKHLCVPKEDDPATLDWAPALLKALKDGAKKRKAVYAPGMDEPY